MSDVAQAEATRAIRTIVGSIPEILEFIVDTPSAAMVPEETMRRKAWERSGRVSVTLLGLLSGLWIGGKAIPATAGDSTCTSVQGTTRSACELQGGQVKCVYIGDDLAAGTTDVIVEVAYVPASGQAGFATDFKTSDDGVLENCSAGTPCNGTTATCAAITGDNGGSTSCSVNPGSGVECIAPPGGACTEDGTIVDCPTGGPGCTCTTSC